MSIYGKVPPSWREQMYNRDLLNASIAESMRQAAEAQRKNAEAYQRGYAEGPKQSDMIDMVEVNGVWMTPEDARRAA
jgi:hypothetical protein